MGLLSKLWHAFESAAAAPQNEAGLTIEELLNLLQQTVLIEDQVPWWVLWKIPIKQSPWSRKICQKIQVIIYLGENYSLYVCISKSPLKIETIIFCGISKRM